MGITKNNSELKKEFKRAISEEIIRMRAAGTDMKEIEDMVISMLKINKDKELKI